jgi:hypothetical protein
VIYSEIDRLKPQPKAAIDAYSARISATGQELPFEQTRICTACNLTGETIRGVLTDQE